MINKIQTPAEQETTVSAEMSESAKAELRALIVAKLLISGSIVSHTPRYYTGWEDYEATYHVQDECGVDVAPDAKLEENYVHEFMGTFYEGDTNVAVVEIKGVTCHCGNIVDRTLRWKGTVGEFIFTLLNDL